MRLPYHKTIMVVCFVLGALCLSCISCAAQGFTKPMAAIIAGSALDAVSTEIALQKPGTREGNVILGQSMPRRVAIKAAGTVGTVWLVQKIGKRSPRTAKIVGYSLGAVYGAVAMRNFQIGSTR